MVRHRNTLRYIDNANTGKHDFAGLSEVKNANLHNTRYCRIGHLGNTTRIRKGV
jgi:hypothetical protein